MTQRLTIARGLLFLTISSSCSVTQCSSSGTDVSESPQACDLSSNQLYDAMQKVALAKREKIIAALGAMTLPQYYDFLHANMRTSLVSIDGGAQRLPSRALEADRDLILAAGRQYQSVAELWHAVGIDPANLSRADFATALGATRTLALDGYNVYILKTNLSPYCAQILRNLGWKLAISGASTIVNLNDDQTFGRFFAMQRAANIARNSAATVRVDATTTISAMGKLTYATPTDHITNEPRFRLECFNIVQTQREPNIQLKGAMPSDFPQMGSFADGNY